MASYLLDTNHASPLVTLQHPLRQRVMSAQQAGHEFAICVPVLNELWYAISLLPRAAQNRAEWLRLRQTITCYVPDESDGMDAASPACRTYKRLGGQVRHALREYQLAPAPCTVPGGKSKRRPCDRIMAIV